VRILSPRSLFPAQFAHLFGRSSWRKRFCLFLRQRPEVENFSRHFSVPSNTFDLRSTGGRVTGLVACMSIVSQTYPNWQLGARSPQAAIDALYFITTIQQQFTGAKTFVYAQGLGTLVANQMAAASATASWPQTKKAQIDGWILDSVRKREGRAFAASRKRNAPNTVAGSSTM
jgi:hypothetical protein